MIKIAVPVSIGEISEQFENYQYFLFYEISNSTVIRRYIEDTQIPDMSLISEWLRKENVNILLVKRIQKEIVRKLNQWKMHVYVGCSKRMPDEAVQDFIKGELITNPSLCY